MLSKTWKVKNIINNKTSDRLRGIIETLLKNRGLTDQKQQESFFNPIHPHSITLNSIGVDSLQTKKAITRLKKALAKNELIIIYGDYDADGITSTAILWEVLHHLKFNVMPFLPHREEHGYGLKPSGIDTVIKQYGKPHLIITVDNGIVAFEGADYCKENGIDLIITDHHSAKKDKNKKDTYPHAQAVIHSTKVAGSGISYLFAKEILEKLKPDFSPKILNSLIELSTIGTIADIVPLISSNRSIAKAGLELLSQTQRPGLKALLSEARIDTGNNLNSYHVGFIIAPRLNATGRLNHCLDSLRLLCTKDENKALRLALNLGDINKERQDMTFKSVKQALSKYTNNHSDKKIIINSSEEYNPGVIGLVAGKLVEHFYKPTVVIAKTGETSKGSVRSIFGVDIIEMLRTFEEDFLELGGHPMAAGFTIKTEKIEDLVQKLEDLAEKTIDVKLLVPVFEADTEIELSDITMRLYEAINNFSPFGAGNPHPTFITRNIEIKNVQTVGKDKNISNFM
jgi:single-stranded-DNA-specific exonuclease